MNQPPVNKNEYGKNLLARPNINRLIEKALEKPVTFIVAGAGCGKSTAVRAALEQSEMKAIYLPLTALDNYSAHFWERFCQGIRVLDCDVATQMEDLGFPEAQEKTNRFLHMLADLCYKQEHVALVFDDLYLVEAQNIRVWIQNLLAASIENLSIVLISRQRPDLESFKAYPTEETPFITRDDLRFSLEDTERYFKMKGIRFTTEQAKQVYDGMEGWPLAIYLIGLQAAKAQQDKDLLENSMPIISDLMEHEIFDHYSDKAKEALVKLSLLESFSDGLVEIAAEDAVEEVQEAIDAIMFASKNPHTQNYSLQHIFLEFLKKKQRMLTSQQKDSFYEKAAGWYRQNGDMTEAATYYFKCKNYNAIWDMIRTYHKYDEVALFYDLIHNFPKQYLDENPIIRVFQAHLHIVFANIDAADSDFHVLEQEFVKLEEGPEKDALLGETYLGLAHTNMIRRSLEFADYYKKAAERLPNGSIIIDENQIYVGTNDAMLLYSNEEGGLQKILDLLFDVMPGASKVMNGCAYGVEHLAASEVYFMQGDYNNATQQAFQAVDKAARKRQHDIVCNSYVMLMRIQFAKGNYKDLKEYLGSLRQYAKEHGSYICDSILDMAEAWLYIKMGHPEKVASWILGDTLSGKTHAPIEVSREKLVKAEYLLENKKYHELLGMLAGTEEFYVERGLFYMRLRTLIIKAVCYYRTNNMGRAVEELRQAYEMTSGNHIIMPFVEYGNHMRTLVQAVKREDGNGVIPEEWLNSVQTKASTYAKRQVFIANEYEKEHQNAVNVLDGLSDREEEVLTDLCQALTREEIADNYNISVNTVKSILRSIYNKLGAVNRADAVRIAMDLRFSGRKEQEGS